MNIFRLIVLLTGIALIGISLGWLPAIGIWFIASATSDFGD